MSNSENSYREGDILHPWQLSDFLTKRAAEAEKNYANANTLDTEGYNKRGFNTEGFNREGFSVSGYNRQGVDKNGFFRDGFNAQGLDKYGFNRRGFNIHGFDNHGFNKNGRDKHGYDASGFNKNGFDNRGFNADKIHYATKTYFNREGISHSGLHFSSFDSLGYDVFGFDVLGYNADGLNADGFDKYGLDINAFDKEGFDIFGYDAFGYDKDGYNATNEACPVFKQIADYFISMGMKENGYDRYSHVFYDDSTDCGSYRALLTWTNDKGERFALEESDYGYGFEYEPTKNYSFSVSSTDEGFTRRSIESEAVRGDREVSALERHYDQLERDN